METRIPKIEMYGPVAEHDQACAVLHDKGVKAVLNLSTGIFEPSWEARREGYYLVQAKTPLQKWILRYIFKKNTI